MYVLVRLTQHVMSAQDAQSFLSMTFASALVQVKRIFDKFMHIQLQSIKEAKLPKRSKCGLLPYVENFEEFSNLAENIFRKTNRRADLDKWYVQLVEAIFNQIPIHAIEHSKTPQQVIKMENYHHMQSLLSQLKVPVLDALKKDSKARYNDSLQAYVTKYFGRPLEKLNVIKICSLSVMKCNQIKHNFLSIFSCSSKVFKRRWHKVSRRLKLAIKWHILNKNYAK